MHVFVHTYIDMISNYNVISKYDFEKCMVCMQWKQIPNTQLLDKYELINIGRKDADDGDTQITNFMGPTWGQPGPCRPQMGLMLAPWTLLLGYVVKINTPLSKPDMMAHIFIITRIMVDIEISLHVNWGPSLSQQSNLDKEQVCLNQC